MAAEQEASLQEACLESGSTSLIQEGDQVVLRMDKTLKIVQVRKNRKIFFEKLNFLIDNAINSPYGSVFEVKGDKLNLIKPDEDADELQATSAENGEKSVEYQPIKSDGQSQKLTRDDVDALKSKGVPGQEIVKQLVENSETFKDRTEFSQAKYKNKKNKKYNAKIAILKPTTRLIARTFYSPRMSNKICELRPDALSQLLSLANIRAKSKVIVVEQCQGLVVGAVLDRMGGYGNIVQIHSGDFPNRLAMECYGFSSSFMETVNAFPLNKVNSLKGTFNQKEEASTSQVAVEKEVHVDETKQQQAGSSSNSSNEQIKDTSSSETVADNGDQPCASSSNSSDEQRKTTTSSSGTVVDNGEEAAKTDVDETNEQPCPSSGNPSDEQREDTSSSETVDNKVEKMVMDEAIQQPSVSSSKPLDDQSTVEDIKEQERIKRRNQRQLEERNARNALLSRNMDSLVVVCKLDPSTIVLELLDYVAPSRPFVIFSTFKEPLVECYGDLKNRGGVVNLQLTETWWRQYQVLPGRTHPLVNMDGSGGYLLSGTTVEKPPETESTHMETQDERIAIPRTPSSGEKHGASQTQEGEPPAKKPKEQTPSTSGEGTEVHVPATQSTVVTASQTVQDKTSETTPVEKPKKQTVGTSAEGTEVQVSATQSTVTVTASQTIQDKTGETTPKQWRQRGKRGGWKARIKAGYSGAPSSQQQNSAGQTRKEETGESQAKNAKEQNKTAQKRGVPVTPSSASQSIQGKTGEPPAKKWRRGKQGRKKDFKNSEIHVQLPFPPPHSHPFSFPHSHPFKPPSFISFPPPPLWTRPSQY